MKPKMIRTAAGRANDETGGNGGRVEGGQENYAYGRENTKRRSRKSNVPIKRRISDEPGGQMDEWSRGVGGYMLKRRHSENWINDEISNGSRIPVRIRRGSWELVKPTTSSSRRGREGAEGDRNALSDSERRRSNGDTNRRYINGQSAGQGGDWSRGRKNLSDSENGGFRIRRRGSYDPTSLRNKKAVQGAMRSRSMGRNHKRRYESAGTERWSSEGLNTSSNNRKANHGRYGFPERLRGGRSGDDARWFSDRKKSYLGFSRGGRGRDPLALSGRGDTSLGTGPDDAGETDYDAVLLLSYQQALER